MSIENGEALEKLKAARYAELLLRALPLSETLGEAMMATEAAMLVAPFPSEKKPKEVMPSDSAKLPPVASAAFSLDNPLAQKVLDRALEAAAKLSASARRDLKAAVASVSPQEAVAAILRFLQRYRQRLTSLLTVAQLSSLLEGAREIARSLPVVPPAGVGAPLPPTLPPAEAVELIEKLRPLSPMRREKALIERPVAEQAFLRTALQVPRPPAPPPISLPEAPEDGPERAYYPVIEAAVRELSEKNLLSRFDYDRLSAAAQQKATVVAGAESQETLEKIRDIMAENVARGVDFKDFQKTIEKEIEGGTVLSDAAQETLFRTSVASAYSDGLLETVQQPFVRSGFPYAIYYATDDDRVRPNHLAMKTNGIDGSNIYRINDPVFILFRPPWSWNCRCFWSPITVRFAAEKGIAEAIKWLETGIEPTPPAFVAMPPFQPPAGFPRASLSVELSQRSLLEFADDRRDAPPVERPKPSYRVEEGICLGGDIRERMGHFAGVNAALGMVKGYWHGPTPPGPDWTLFQTGARGGKIWAPPANYGQQKQEAKDKKKADRQAIVDQRKAAALKAKEDKAALRLKAREDKAALAAQAKADKAAAAAQSKAQKLKDEQDAVANAFAAAKEIAKDPSKATPQQVAAVGAALLLLKKDDLQKLKKEMGATGRGFGGATKPEMVAAIKKKALGAAATAAPATQQPPAAPVPVAPPQAPQVAPFDPRKAVFIVTNLAQQGGGLADLVDVRRLLGKAGLPDRAAQDGLIKGLLADGSLTASPYEGRHGISDAQKAAQMDDPGAPLGSQKLGHLTVKGMPLAPPGTPKGPELEVPPLLETATPEATPIPVQPPPARPVRKQARAEDFAKDHPKFIGGPMFRKNADALIASADKAAASLTTAEFEKWTQLVGITVSGATKIAKLSSFKNSVNRLAVSTQQTNFGGSGDKPAQTDEELQRQYDERMREFRENPNDPKFHAGAAPPGVEQPKIVPQPVFQKGPATPHSGKPPIVLGSAKEYAAGFENRMHSLKTEEADEINHRAESILANRKMTSRDFQEFARLLGLTVSGTKAQMLQTFKNYTNRLAVSHGQTQF